MSFISIPWEDFWKSRFGSKIGKGAFYPFKVMTHFDEIGCLFTLALRAKGK